MKEINFTKVEEEGGSGKVPSGVLQFKRDWPGIWIRGDETSTLEYLLNQIVKDYEGKPEDKHAVALVLHASNYLEIINKTFLDTKIHGHPHD